MEIIKTKNIFMLCAVKGCKHRATTSIHLKSGGIFQKIYVCEECSFDILNFSHIINSSF